MDKLLEAHRRKKIFKNDENNPDEGSSERFIWKFWRQRI